MSAFVRTLIAGYCLFLSGCLSMWTPYGHVVSNWAGEETSFEPPPIADLNKIPDPPADNNSAEATQAPESVRTETSNGGSPFDRARSRQQSTEPPTAENLPTVTPVEHRGGTPHLVGPIVGDPKPMTPPLLIPPTPAQTTQPQPSQPVDSAQPLPGGPLMPAVPVGIPGGRMNPTVRGGILNLGPNDTGVERALELANRLSLLEGENQILLQRVKQLEGDLEAREKLIDASNAEVAAAGQDVARARTEIEALRKDLSAARDRLRQAAKDDVETLQTILSVLRRLTPSAAPMRPAVGE